jgi:hypothetical protein
MAITKKNLIDEILIILTRFSITDDSVLDEDYISFLIDKVRAQLIVKDYQETGVINQAWLTDLGIVAFHKVTFADDPVVNFCECDISKAFIPKPVALISPEGGNTDVGLKIISACGKDNYYQYPIDMWRNIPSEHIRSKFRYYYRVNTALYVNKKVDNLRIIAILETPSEGYIIQSEPVTTIAAGTDYIVKNKQIVYNSTMYNPDDTFTGVAGFTTFSGTGTVYLADQLQELDETEPYPVSADMARMIVLEICTKEFKIEESQIIDVQNNSKDEQVQQA